jgi:hypothetical protein
MIIFYHNLEKALNMKLILCFLEQLSGLKINFSEKRGLFPGQAKETEEQYKQLFGFESVFFLFKYLCIPFHLKNGEWKWIEDHFRSN